MPVFEFKCTVCGDQFERYLPLRTSDNPSCERGDCSGSTDRVWTISRHHPGSVYPFITRNIIPGGKPVEVTSASHMESLCKQYGKVNRADAAFIEETYCGVDPHTRKQIYKEGTGAGIPGSWAAIPSLLQEGPEAIEDFYRGR